MPTVADAMITEHQVLGADVTVAELRDFFANDRVHAALLVDDGYLRAVVTRDDLDAEEPKGVLTGRTIGPDADHDRTLERMQRTGQRRLAVVDPDGRLLGLLCLKRSRTGFCTHADLAARREERRTTTKATTPSTRPSTAPVTAAGSSKPVQSGTGGNGR